MSLPIKDLLFFISLLSCMVLIACHSKRPDPPNGWIQKVNNQTIGRITLDNQVFNCAATRKKHVICTPILDSIEYVCAALVTFNDGAPRERWEKACPAFGTTDTLIFDDGKFSYFYGIKSNP